jgi:LacI family transcriptional regulator
MGSQPTIKDVAKKAGVSITTVSFVLNNRTDVVISEAVKKRVLKVAQEMDYHPSAMAAGLAGKRTKNLGLVFYQDNIISNLFYSFVIEGIVKETIDKGFNLFFTYLESDYQGYQSLPRIIREKNVDGVLLIARSDPKMAAEILKRGLPVVAIDVYPALKGVSTMEVNNRQGAFMAVEHLFNLGHKHIGLLTIAKGRPSIDDREEGWKSAHVRHKQPLNPGYRFECENLSFHTGYRVAKEILQKNRKMTALFCVNDEMAAGVLRAAHELGRRVPEELSVVGFDNITMSNYTDPPLTTVSVAKEFMGKAAVNLVLELIGDKETPMRRQEVPVELITRASTAKPPSR